MNPDQVLRVYDQEYAESYDAKFLFSERWKPKYDLELKLLTGLLREDDRWLDVGCGTGHFLSRFPAIARAGLDLSPEMLKIARTANPGVPFYQGDFRQPHPEWEGKWSFVSSMWYAYCLVESVSDVKRLVRNLAAWTADDGRCFLPLFHPEKATKLNIPYALPEIFGGQFFITGVIWSWKESAEKFHENLIAPQLEYMVLLFEELFASVEVITYTEEKIITPFKAILASRPGPRETLRSVPP